ncbi:CAP domain-containing protein [Saccharothrix lopnurensis]|uniref:CAP domain-containing protein n=1 Tax=Saccharothrix lopnurensis TaxID=1670621 RepID=A0ABW1PFQ0_9PSEU
MSRKSRVLPLAAVLTGLVLTGCEHPDGTALVTVNATAELKAAIGTPTRAATSSRPATPSSGTTTTTTGTSTTEVPPTTTTTTTTAEPAAPRPEDQPRPRVDTPAAPPKPTAPDAPARSEVEIAEARVVELTNAERAAQGCPALAADDRLAAAARAHSADMAARDYFDHVSQDGRSFVDRVKAAGYPSPGAENIAAGQRTAEAVVKGWMDSPGHRANILNCKLKALGAGMARGGSYGIYWTQNFGW